MSAGTPKLERLVNLLILLMSARRPLTVEQIRDMHPAYDQPDEESFRRMFERDKDELRDLGVPIEVVALDVLDENEQGYRVRREDYALPEVSLEPDEAAAVALAARLWQSAGLADASRTALLKLRAAGLEGDAVPLRSVEPRVDVREAAFGPIVAAVRAASPVRFAYRSGGAGDAATREVDPWGVVHRRGRGYLVGHDRAREDVRVFRLDRIVGKVTALKAGTALRAPEGTDLRDLVAQAAEPGSGDAAALATVQVAAGACWELRLEARETQAGPIGWDVLTLPMADVERLADQVVGFGPDALVLTPPALREAVIARLRAVVGS